MNPPLSVVVTLALFIAFLGILLKIFWSRTEYELRKAFVLFAFAAVAMVSMLLLFPYATVREVAVAEYVRNLTLINYYTYTTVINKTTTTITTTVTESNTTTVTATIRSPIYEPAPETLYLQNMVILTIMLCILLGMLFVLEYIVRKLSRWPL